MLGQHADAEAQFAKLKASQADTASYQYAEIYAQWGDMQQALRWLGSALQARDSGLAELRVDPLLDPLRNQPRCQAVERQLWRLTKRLKPSVKLSRSSGAAALKPVLKPKIR